MEQINITYDLFLNAKDQINSIPPNYTEALNTLRKIPIECETMCIEHMKILCLFMLEQFEDIIEYYYINKSKVLTYVSLNECSASPYTTEGTVSSTIYPSIP